MAKPTAVWGIDLGQCALKALRLELVNGVPTATAFDYIEHAKILSQPDADADQLTREALEKFLSRNQLGRDLVAIGVPGQSGLSRFVKLPPVEPSKIPDIVRFEAKQQVPFPLEEVVWDYQKLYGGEVVDKFAMETEIGLFAMKKEVIAKYLGQFSSMDIEVHVVQMTPLALCNYATYELLGKGGPNPPPAPAEDDTPRGKKRCVVVLDIGTETSNLIITDAAKIIWQRPLPLGGNHFTRALSKEMKLTFAKAEHLKRNAAKSPDLATILKSLRPVLTDFVGEVQRSLGYFSNTHRDAYVSHLVGLGSAFRLPGLQKYMSEKLSLEVKRPSSIDRLEGDAVKSDPVFVDNLLTFPVAYGLALQGLNELGDRKDYGRINTNLLPPQLKVERMIRAKKPYAAAAAAALLLGTGILALGYSAAYASVNDKRLQESIKTAKAAAALANNQKSQKQSGEAEIAKIQADVKAIIKGNDSRLDLIRMNEVLLAALPRHGEDGNLRHPEAVRYWSTPEGQDAKRLYDKRIREGLAQDAAGEGDKSEHLAQVQIESVYMQYTDNLKGFLENADREAKTRWARDIADTLLPSEVEQSTTTPPRKVPKAPDGVNSGWVYQLSGYTQHERGVDFLINGLVRNIQAINAPGGFADQTLAKVRNEKGEEVDVISYYLPGVKDPVKGRVSHVFLLLTKQVRDPQPKVFEFIGPRYIDALIPAPVPAGTAAAASGLPSDAGAGGAAAPQQQGNGWAPLTNFGTAPPAGDTASPFGGGPPPAGPAAASEPAAATGKKYRQEFVLCFIWRDADAASPNPTP